MYLSIHVTVPAIVTPAGKVDPGVSSEGEAIIVDGDGPHRPVRGHDEHLAEVLDIDGAHTLGQGGAGQGRETGDQQHLQDETVPESGSKNTDWPGGFVHPIYSAHIIIRMFLYTTRQTKITL